MDLPLYQRRELPPAQVGAVKPPYELADRRGQIRMGQTIAQLGGNLLERIISSQVDTDLSTGQLAIHNKWMEYQKWQNDNPDKAVDEAQNQTQFKAMFGEGTKNQILAGAETPEGKKRLNLFWNHQALVVYSGYAQNEAMKLASAQQELAFRTNIKSWSMQGTEDARKFGNDAITERQNKGFLIPEEANLMRQEFNAAIDKTQKDVGYENLWGQLSDIASEKGWEAARTVLNDPKIVKNIPVDMQDKLTERVDTKLAFEKKKRDEELAKQQETDRNALSTALRGKELTHDVIDNTSLDEKEQQTWHDRLDAEVKRIRKGEEIITNPETKANLGSDAYKIWTGAITIRDFREYLDKARYDGLIEDNDYDELWKKAQTELKASQAAALSESDERAGRALVDYKSEPEWLAAYSAATGEEKKTLSDKRKLQFELLNQYNNEVRSWIFDNPEATGKEFEQFRDRKRFEFINRRAELEKTLKSRIEDIGKKPAKEMRKRGESISEYLKRTGQE